LLQRNVSDDDWWRKIEIVFKSIEAIINLICNRCLMCPYQVCKVSSWNGTFVDIVAMGERMIMSPIYWWTNHGAREYKIK
jgi:hypothetical protein